MITCLAIGATIMSLLLLTMAIGGVICIFEAVQADDDPKILRHICAIPITITLAAITCGATFWLWQKALAQ